ncbi:MAG: hypothetical protein M1374_02830 [Firmicutes bacterium]|jgi:hypothetical protein|nr:hypothetical protein [Bacillota bacterium]
MQAPSETETGADKKDLAAKLTAYLETAVDMVRDKSTKPLAGIINTVFIVVMLLLGVSFLSVIFTLGVFRLLNDLVFSGRVWATYLLVGGIFFLIGLFLIRKIGKERSHIV